MRKLTILVDLDDTMTDLIPPWINMLNKRFDTNVKPADVTDWDMPLFFPKHIPESLIYEPLYEPELWEAVQPKPDAAEYLLRLKGEGHRIVVVTASSYRSLDIKMNCVLSRDFPFLSWDDIIVTSQKQLVRGNVLIDDGFHNLFGGAYRKILMDAPHNQGVLKDKHPDIIRVHNWAEAYGAVCAIACEEVAI